MKKKWNVIKWKIERYILSKIGAQESLKNSEFQSIANILYTISSHRLSEPKYRVNVNKSHFQDSSKQQPAKFAVN